LVAARRMVDAVSAALEAWDEVHVIFCVFQKQLWLADQIRR
jgi:hypothetical protein